MKEWRDTQYPNPTTLLMYRQGVLPFRLPEDEVGLNTAHAWYNPRVYPTLSLIAQLNLLSKLSRGRHLWNSRARRIHWTKEGRNYGSRYFRGLTSKTYARTTGNWSAQGWGYYFNHNFMARELKQMCNLRELGMLQDNITQKQFLQSPTVARHRPGKLYSCSLLWVSIIFNAVTIVQRPSHTFVLITQIRGIL